MEGNPLYGIRSMGRSFAVAAGAATQPVQIPRIGAGITAIPGAGATVRVFKSTSPWDSILADVADGSLSYANLLAETAPTLSRWMPWASGAVTDITNEGPIESAGDVAVIAITTDGPAVLEVSY